MGNCERLARVLDLSRALSWRPWRLGGSISAIRIRRGLGWSGHEPAIHPERDPFEENRVMKARHWILLGGFSPSRRRPRGRRSRTHRRPPASPNCRTPTTARSFATSRRTSPRSRRPRTSTRPISRSSTRRSSTTGSSTTRRRPVDTSPTSPTARSARSHRSSRRWRGPQGASSPRRSRSSRP